MFDFFCILHQKIKCLAESFCYDTIQVFLAGFWWALSVFSNDVTHVGQKGNSGSLSKISDFLKVHFVRYLNNQIELWKIVILNGHWIVFEIMKESWSDRGFDFLPLNMQQTHIKFLFDVKKFKNSSFLVFNWVVINDKND